MTAPVSARYAEGAAVETRYPRTPGEEAGPRSGWGWVPGTVMEQCGPDEWSVDLETGATVFRDAAEIRPAAVSAFRCPCCGDDVMGTPPLCAGCRV